MSAVLPGARPTSFTWPAPRVRPTRPTAPALPGWAPQVPALAALALLPWLAVLVLCHETVWVVLDLGELSALLWLDALLRRRSPGALGPACVVALLLAGDALADVGTAGRGLPLLAALVMACGVELPLAVLCLALGRGAAAAEPGSGPVPGAAGRLGGGRAPTERPDGRPDARSDGRPGQRPPAMRAIRARVSSSLGV